MRLIMALCGTVVIAVATSTVGNHGRRKTNAKEAGTRLWAAFEGQRILQRP